MRSFSSSFTAVLLVVATIAGFSATVASAKTNNAKTLVVTVRPTNGNTTLQLGQLAQFSIVVQNPNDNRPINGVHVQWTANVYGGIVFASGSGDVATIPGGNGANVGIGFTAPTTGSAYEIHVTVTAKGGVSGTGYLNGSLAA